MRCMAAEDRMRANEQRYVNELELLRSEACGFAWDLGTAQVMARQAMMKDPIYGKILKRMQRRFEAGK